MVMEEPVQVAIWQSLNNYCYEDAVFLSERLYAEASSDETLLLLATSYYRSGSVKRAYSLLQRHSPVNTHCKYLMAKCCADLEKFAEAEHLLVGSSGIFFNAKVVENIISEYGNLAGYVLRLLGLVFRRSDNISKAAECFKASLKCNPFLWTSFQLLCQMGELNLVDKRQTNEILRIFASGSAKRANNFRFKEGEAVDPQDYFKVSNCSSEMSDGLTPYALKIGSSDKPLNTMSDSKTNCPYDSMSSENMDPCHGPSALLMTSTVVSKPSSNQQLRTSADTEMPPPSDVVVREHARSKVGRNLLGAATSNSPLTPSFGILPQDTPPAEGVATDFITPPAVVTDAMAPSAPTKKKKTKQLVHHDIRKNEGKNTRSNFTGIMAGPSKIANTPSPSSMMTPSPTTTSVGITNMGLRRSSRLFVSNSGGSNNSSKDTKKTSKVQFSESTKSSNVSRKTRTRRTRFSTSTPLASSTENIQQNITPQQQPIQQIKSDAKEEKLEMSAIQSSTNGIMQLFQDIGKAYAALTAYECKKAIRLFESLPSHQLNTCWVLQQIGTAYFEIAEYHSAEKKFIELRRLDKYHMKGMVIFSTLLWFLKKEGSLSSLALDLVELDRLAPEAWCAMGNCYSLQKEHDSSIKFIQRAIQLDPYFTYAYTLLGHEYVLTEEVDKGLSCFRTSIRLDSRHYNAWYGMAMIYYKQEDYQLAEKHFLRALQINPKNSVLLCHLAVTQNAMKKPLQALQTINKAISLMPKNALCKYHKCSFLFTLERLDEAVCELEQLRRIVPKEALIYVLLGKVYRKKGEPHLAEMNFSWARSLDPQVTNNLVKEARYTQEDDDTSAADFDISDPVDESADLDEIMSDLEAQEESRFNDSSNGSSQ